MARALKKMRYADPNKNKMITLRIASTDYERLKIMANKNDMSVSNYLRECALTYSDDFNIAIKIKKNIDHNLSNIFTECRRQGNNINQIAHAVNSNASKLSDAEVNRINDTLKEISQTLSRIEDKVIA